MEKIEIFLFILVFVCIFGVFFILFKFHGPSFDRDSVIEQIQNNNIQTILGKDNVPDTLKKLLLS